MTQWFYQHPVQGQTGPVDAATIRDAFEQGTLHTDTLVWTEGMAQWQPLHLCATELGIDSAALAAAPAAPAPPTIAPAQQPMGYTPAQPVVIPPPKSNTGCILAVVVGVGALILVAILGILAAIFIPAYQQYTERAQNAQQSAQDTIETMPNTAAHNDVASGSNASAPKDMVAQAMTPALGGRSTVHDFYHANQRCPSNQEVPELMAQIYAGSSHVQHVGIGADSDSDCAINVILKDVHPDIDGARIVLWMDVSDPSTPWYCYTTAEPAPTSLLPSECVH